MGLNVYHDEFNAPAFLSILPDVKDLEGLDIGCGEGTDTRLLAKRGAQMTAIDVSEKFITYAKESEDREPLGIRYQVASVWSIPFPDGRFDFASATMSLMDIPQPERAIKEIFRVLKPRGFLQFSITHPCFDTPYKKWVDDANGKHVAAVVGDYFKEMDGEIEEWIFSFTPSEVKEKLRKFRIPRFTRTLSSWFNTLVDAGFIIERVLEPTASDETINHFPHLEDTRIISHFLIVRCRKPRD
jgi:ubiquinone/menaquinone biosynthesis C-methylase UbiE